MRQVSAEDFEREARAAAAAAPDADTEVLQKLLTVKDQMIWCVLRAPSHCASCA